MKRVVIAAGCIALLACSGATAASLITGAQVKNGSLTGRDIKNHSIKRADLAASARGRTGPQGPVGAGGPQGPPAPTVRLADATDTSVVPAGVTFGAEASCPPEAPYALSGAFTFKDVSGATSADTKPTVLRSEPTSERRGWRLIVRNDGPQSLVATVVATCTSR